MGTRTDASSTSRARGNRAGDERRAKILAAAVAQFTEHGYHGTSIGAIARAADITDQGILYHFGSKAELFAAVLERREEPMAAAFTAIPSGFDELVEGMIEVIAQTADQPELVRFQAALSGELAMPGHPFHARYAENQRRGTAILTEHIAGFIASGELATEVDPAAIARELIALHRGLRAAWVLEPGRFDLATAFATAARRLAGSVPRGSARVSRTISRTASGRTARRSGTERDRRAG